MTIDNLSTDFKPNCHRQNIKVSDDDLKLIERTLWQLPAERHKIVLRDYQFEWVLGMRESTNASLKQRQGRLRANNYVLELVK